MPKQKQKIDINQKDGVVSIQVRSGRSVDSDMSGNVVIDYDRQGRVVRVNIYAIDFDAFREHHQALKHFGQSANMPVVFR